MAEPPGAGETDATSSTPHGAGQVLTPSSDLRGAEHVEHVEGEQLDDAGRGRVAADGAGGGPQAVQAAATELAEAVTAVAHPHRIPWRWVAVVGVVLLAILFARNQDRRPDEPQGRSEDRVVFVDVEGWYRRTADEVAVRTPFDWQIDGLKGTLPMRIGPWQGRERPYDAAIDEWFQNPDVAIQRTYRREDGQIIWLSAFGSRGDKSFHLFEHTPDSCYPLGGWEMQKLEVARLPLGPRPFPVNYGLAAGSKGQLVVFYFYLWDSPVRDAERGVLSLRIAAPVRDTPEKTYALLAQDFLPRMFPKTLTWSRF